MVTATNALVVSGLKKSYGSVVAVDGLDLAVRNGECFGLLGPNGAGKTTTIEVCEGLLARDSGSVEVLGRTWENDAAELRDVRLHDVHPDAAAGQLAFHPFVDIHGPAGPAQH